MSIDSKLYVKVKCTVCLSKLKSSCYYCSPYGETYVEAADVVVLRWLQDLEPERLQEILKKLTSVEKKEKKTRKSKQDLQK